MDKRIVRYLSEIGRKGGLKSRRKLDPKVASEMARLRDARRYFKKYHNKCFWSYDENYQIQNADIAWVADQLMKNGDARLWAIGAKLCR